MKIETYEVELVDQTEMQALASEGEHAMLIEKLGLEGQRSLMGGEKITPFPYRIMTKQEQLVFELLFPFKTALHEFASELIPLRVLQVAAHAKDTNFLTKGLFVWHPEDSKHDPVLVGHTSDPQTFYATRYFLLARWGAAFKPFEALLTQAKTMWCQNRTAKLAKAKVEVENESKMVREMADLYFNGKSVETSVYFY